MKRRSPPVLTTCAVTRSSTVRPAHESRDSTETDVVDTSCGSEAGGFRGTVVPTPGQDAPGAGAHVVTVALIQFGGTLPGPNGVGLLPGSIVLHCVPRIPGTAITVAALNG